MGLLSGFHYVPSPSQPSLSRTPPGPCGPAGRSNVCVTGDSEPLLWGQSAAAARPPRPRRWLVRAVETPWPCHGTLGCCQVLGWCHLYVPRSVSFPLCSGREPAITGLSKVPVSPALLRVQWDPMESLGEKPLSGERPV